MKETLKHMFLGCDYQAVERAGHQIVACTICGVQYRHARHDVMVHLTSARGTDNFILV